MMDQDPCTSTAEKSASQDDSAMSLDVSDTVTKDCVVDETDKSFRNELCEVLPSEKEDEAKGEGSGEKNSEVIEETEKAPGDTVPESPEDNTQDRLDPPVELLEESTSDSPKSHSPEADGLVENPLKLDGEEKTDEEASNSSDGKTSEKVLSKDTDQEKTDREECSEPSSKPLVEDKPSESSSKITDMEISSEPKKPTDEVLLIDSDKEDDKLSETEKTEFVQITHDKQAESPTEGQSMDAEDPFGGDTPADEAASMDTEELNERSRSFSQLGGETDNLQDVVKATTSSEVETLEGEDSGKPGEEEKEGDKETQEKDGKSDKDSSDNKEGEKKPADDDEVIDEIIEIPASSSKSIDSDKSKSKDKDGDVEVISVESEEQSTVLPGQDDELCIIPDDMKIILPIRPKPLSEIVAKKDTVPTEASEKPASAASSTETEKEAEAAPKDKVDDGKSTEAPTKETPIDTVIEVDDTVQSKPAKEVEKVALTEQCKQCGEEKYCRIRVKSGTEAFSVCSKRCQNAFMDTHGKATDIPSEGANSKYEKRCASCLLIVESYDDRNLQWETMEFCNEECLGKFQTKYGSYCRNCNGNVQPISLGKYCVRFGYDVRQFCCSTCLEEFKKGLKVCSYCQKDISSGPDGFLAPVGDKGQFKDFCTQHCMEKYARMNSSEPPPPEIKACSVCQEEKIVFCEVQIDRGQGQAICSEPCFAAFKFVNKVDPDQCSTCKKYFQVANKKSTVVFYNNEAHTFCNKSCLNIFIITNRKIVPCNWCKVKKYNFDMIRKELKSGQVVMMCSLNCLTLYQVSINAVSAKRIKCDLCKDCSQAQYHLTMSDATIRNFCSYNCVMKFQAQYTKSPITIPAGDDTPVPTGMPKRTYPGKIIQGVVKKGGEIQGITNLQAITSLQSLSNKKSLPVISSVASLASLSSNGQSAIAQKATTNVVSLNNATITNPTASQPQVIFKQQVITRPTSPVQVHNKMTQCKPLTHTKGVSVKPHPCTKSTQTDEVQKVLIPIPVPIYVPFPMHMFSFPFPVPVPFPLPIPVPIFIPTTKNSTKSIFKDLKRIQEKMPSDPFEAELLMMAEMVATEKKKTDSDSSDSSDDEPENVQEAEEKSENNDPGNTFGEEILQMALNIANDDVGEPAVDLEAALTSNTITAAPAAEGEENEVPSRGRKRTVAFKSKSGSNKKMKRSSSVGEPLMPPPESQSTQPKVLEPAEKPDANMVLKYTFGVNAWRHWVNSKNAELEKQITQNKKVKLFKTDLLQLTADELNYTLCLFVKEVCKPNGTEYAPDTIYYLCLGIQQYLFENNRIDNIFTDSYYEKFTDCLNEVASKFSVLYNDAQYIVTRVEEEHLWECKQLGAHSPHVLLSTLMFFNTKHFNLATVEEHMQLSFSHIMKHWKRNPAVPGGPKVPGGRNILLRFYPPVSALEANSRKKKVYEQQENEDNPLRCPVKLYEFYLSKCPESVRTRNDVFYLLPERSCVPDSPVWYSTSPLAKENLVKMLNRVKMVKEINVALLGS